MVSEMAKFLDEQILQARIEESDGQLVAYLMNADGDVLDLASHCKPAGHRSRLLTLRAARRAMAKGMRKLDRLIAREMKG
jgi:hypothetical protein